MFNFATWRVLTYSYFIFNSFIFLSQLFKCGTHFNSVFRILLSSPSKFIILFKHKDMVLFYFLTFLFLAQSQTLYNHNSHNSYRNQTWMSLFDDGIPLRKLNILGTHSSMSTGSWGDAIQTQSLSLLVQMESGVRALDIRCRHYSNTFRIH